MTITGSLRFIHFCSYTNAWRIFSSRTHPFLLSILLLSLPFWPDFMVKRNNLVPHKPTEQQALSRFLKYHLLVASGITTVMYDKFNFMYAGKYEIWRVTPLTNQKIKYCHLQKRSMYQFLFNFPLLRSQNICCDRNAQMLSHMQHLHWSSENTSICFIMFLSTKPKQKYHNKQSLHLPWVLNAHSPAVHTTLLYRTVSKCQSPTSKQVSELSVNISCYMTEFILMNKQVIFSYFEVDLRAFWKYFLLRGAFHK
jgi:hypothetical protein